MMDINKHRVYLFQILKEIYSNPVLANALGFKGGTALMFFYDLPRFSTDLDFNLIENDEEMVFDLVKKIIMNFGQIYDEAMKFYGPVIVLDYGKGERKLKIEISNRSFDDQYEIKNLLGVQIKVMVESDMFAHKLCALLDRRNLANRDLFDCWFFMNRRTPINDQIVKTRMKMDLSEYLGQCIQVLEKLKQKNRLQGLGELLDDNMKPFIRKKLLPDTIELMRFYQKYPIIRSR